MDFLAVFTSLATMDNLFAVVCAGLLVWTFVRYIPNRDKENNARIEARDKEYAARIEARDKEYSDRLEMITDRFTNMLSEHDSEFRDLIEQIRKDERESHSYIIDKLSNHDKHSMAANHKIDDIHNKVIMRQ